MIKIEGYLDFMYEIPAGKVSAEDDRIVAEDATKRFDFLAVGMDLPIRANEFKIGIASSIRADGKKRGLAVRMVPIFDLTDEEKKRAVALILLCLQKRVMLELISSKSDVTAPPVVAEDGQISFLFGEIGQGDVASNVH